MQSHQHTRFSLPNQVFFLASLVLFALGYQYQHYIFEPPLYMHQWRQVDGAMIARKYFEEGMDFFGPQRNNLYLNGDPYGISEFPVLYYLTAALYKLFGFQHWYLRALNLLIVAISLFSLRRLLAYVTASPWMATLLTLLYITSPVVVFYAPNFLPDAPAVAFCLIGLERLITGVWQNKRWTWMAGIGLISLGAMIKPPAMIPFLAAGSAALWVMIFDPGSALAIRIRRQGIGLAIGMAIPMAMLALWIGYVQWFNHQHGSIYFLTRIAPVWEISASGVLAGFIKAFHFAADYANKPILIVVLLLALAVLLPKLNDENEKGYRVFFVGYTGLLLAYFLLFFQQFQHHDYYFLVMIPWVPATVAFAYAFYQRPSGGADKAALWFTAIAVAASFTYAIFRHQERTAGYPSPYVANNDFQGMEPVLDSLGIDRDKKIFVAGDITSGVSLYFMHRDGYTENTGYDFNVTGDSLLRWGLTHADFLATHPNYQPSPGFQKAVSLQQLTPMGRHNRITIYRIVK